jgi:hypothetical protein
MPALNAVSLTIASLIVTVSAFAQDFALHTFERQQLTDVYFSEGASAGDINRDGKDDVVYGPYWFAGPDYKAKSEIYAAKAQPTERYADNFFSWIHDFNGDGWNDVFVVGFPGTPAYVYENPTGGKLDQHWTKHQVFDWVSNESPHFTNIVGDERPELVCTRDGRFGYATVNWDQPFDAWTFHAISEKVADARFGHGLGVGDVNGDGKLDVIQTKGWFEQPASDPNAGLWKPHAADFTNAYGGAEMYAYDVDGDGDNDVIASLAAHDFGLAWHEQVRDGNDITFKRHLIMGSRPDRYGVVFSELHSLALTDIDGDGLKDIVTGKTYWSHHKQSPMWDAGAVVYWFKLTRTKDGVDWVPFRADDDSGIGRQVVVKDINGDKLPDIVVGGMKGSHVLVHRRETLNEQRYRETLPKPYVPKVSATARNPRSPINAETGRVLNALEGEVLKVLNVTAGKTVVQKMGGFKADRWSGNEQLFWTGAKPGDRLELGFATPKPGTFLVDIALTMARDYAIVKLFLNDRPLGEPLDLFNDPDVITTGVYSLGKHELTADSRLTIEITGANPAAAKAYMVGVDYLRLSDAK